LDADNHDKRIPSISRAPYFIEVAIQVALNGTDNKAINVFKTIISETDAVSHDTTD